MKKYIGAITLSYLLSGALFHYKATQEEKQALASPYYRHTQLMSNADNYRKIRNESSLLAMLSTMLIIYPRNKKDIISN